MQSHTSTMWKAVATTTFGGGDPLAGNPSGPALPGRSGRVHGMQDPLPLASF